MGFSMYFSSKHGTNMGQIRIFHNLKPAGSKECLRYLPLKLPKSETNKMQRSERTSKSEYFHPNTQTDN